MPRPPIIRMQIVELLERDGPMTIEEIAEALGKTKESIDGILRKTMVLAPDALHIARYQPQVGRKGKASPLFAAGAGKNATRPKPQPREVVSQRYERKHYAVRRLRDNARSAAPMPLWLAVLGVQR